MGCEKSAKVEGRAGQPMHTYVDGEVLVQAEIGKWNGLRERTDDRRTVMKR